MKAKPMSPSKSGRNIQSTDTSFVPEEARKHVRNIGLKTFHFQKHCNRATIETYSKCHQLKDKAYLLKGSFFLMMEKQFVDCKVPIYFLFLIKYLPSIYVSAIC